MFNNGVLEDRTIQTSASAMNLVAQSGLKFEKFDLNPGFVRCELVLSEDIFTENAKKISLC